MSTRPRRNRALNAHLSISEALDAAEALWREFDLTHDIDIAVLLAELVDYCDDAQIASVGDLASQAGEIVRDLTGVVGWTAFADRETAARLNQVRNIIRILICSTALHQGEDPKALLADLPNVTGRSTNKRRALDDDEILVLRLEALRRAVKGGGAARIAAQYILIEAGATTSEIEHVTLGCFNDHKAPTGVRLCGNGNDVAIRTVAIPSWARKAIALVLAQHIRLRGPATGTPVAYQAEGGNSTNSAAAVCTNIARVMTDLGLGKANFRPEPHAILRWRLRYTRDSEGIGAAVLLAGRPTTKALYTFLTMEAPRKPATRRKGHVNSMLGQ